MNKAVFLDRDGVIIRERGEYNYLPRHLEIVEGIVEFCQEAQAKGYLLIVISNQSGIAKGIYTQRHVRQIHRYVRDFFASYSVKITDFYFCPHHPDFSACLCRKPGTLLIEKAMAVHKIDPTSSFFIGDMSRDEEAGQAAGLKTILIRSNENPRRFSELL